MYSIKHTHTHSQWIQTLVQQLQKKHFITVRSHTKTLFWVHRKNVPVTGDLVAKNGLNLQLRLQESDAVHSVPPHPTTPC